MRKDIKKRLKRALITLEEPRGSTIQSIINVINKDAPQLSVRKVLEALQDGINEGFLCMYNGRFKLKQQVQPDGNVRDASEYRKEDLAQRKESAKTKTQESNIADDGSDYLSDDEDEEFDYEQTCPPVSSKKHSKQLSDFHIAKKFHNCASKKTYMRREQPHQVKGKYKRRGRGQSKKVKKYNREPRKREDSVLEMTSNESEKSGRPTAERPDVRKQRGPRCTSMKKDVTIPSKVHIPSVPPSMPQRSNNFNELLRRSPKPVNGPLFDSITLTAANLGIFSTY